MAVIEYFCAAHSGYAYVGSKLLSEVAAAAGARIDHRPFDWHAVLAANGPNPTNGLTPQRQAYFSGREIERWAEARGLEIITGRMPTYHDNDYGFANCMLIASSLEGAGTDALANRLLEAHWRDDADLADAATLFASRQRSGCRRGTVVGCGEFGGGPSHLSVEHRRSDRAVGLRFADLLRRRRYVLRPGSPGTRGARLGETLLRNLAAPGCIKKTKMGKYRRVNVSSGRPLEPLAHH